MQYSGRPGARFLLRVDCEHTEAQRWTGDGCIERAGLERLLELFRREDVRATFAFVGLTALWLPDLARAALAENHAVIGHSHAHTGPYAGRPLQWQSEDMAAMIGAIEGACGSRVRGLAAPGHGRIDAATIRAAAVNGLDYVLNMTHVRAGAAEFAPLPGLPEAVRVPPARMKVVWDWTDLQPEWPPFTAEAALAEWRPALDAALSEGGLTSLIVHPWIVEANDEYELISAFVEEARSKGARVATFDEVVAPAAGLARGEGHNSLEVGD